MKKASLELVQYLLNAECRMADRLDTLIQKTVF